MDTSPFDDSEFDRSGTSAATGRMDLFSVLLHEVGHVLGHDHGTTVGGSTSLMSHRLHAGERLVSAATPVHLAPPTDVSASAPEAATTRDDRTWRMPAISAPLLPATGAAFPASPSTADEPTRSVDTDGVRVDGLLVLLLLALSLRPRRARSREREAAHWAV